MLHLSISDMLMLHLSISDINHATVTFTGFKSNFRNSTLEVFNEFIRNNIRFLISLYIN